MEALDVPEKDNTAILICTNSLVFTTVIKIAEVIIDSVLQMRRVGTREV